MANPTGSQLFGLSEEDNLATILNNFGIFGVTDAREAARQICARLHRQYTLFTEENRPEKFTATFERDNIDIDTQQQIFTFTFDVALTAPLIENEPA